MEITSLKQLDIVNGVYTYADYLLWKIKERVELFKGKIFEMSAPSERHQEIAGNLHGEMYMYFKNKPCKLYVSPFDVRLPKKNEKGNQILTVVQPDICVVCDLSKIDKNGCSGAPDLVVEVTSPGNSKKEMKNKFDLYEEAGVKEYWVVRPNEKEINIFVLENGKFKYVNSIFEGEMLKSHIFPELEMNSKEIFNIKK